MSESRPAPQDIRLVLAYLQARLAQMRSQPRERWDDSLRLISKEFLGTKPDTA